MCQPAGTGKSLVAGELARQLLQERGRAWTVLVLTSRAELARQYLENLDQLLGGSRTVELADTGAKLADRVRMPGIILVSTAQKLLARGAQRTDQVPPLSASDRLLVIVEEASYHYFSQTYRDMRLRFPNAAFLGMTVDCEPSERLLRAFGPVLYRYSYRQACLDGYLMPVRYRYVDGMEAWGPGEDARERIGRCAAWLAKQEQGESRSALLLCEDASAAVQFYWHLLSCLGPGKVKMSLAAPGTADLLKKTGSLPAESRWDGKSFSGLVIACSPPMAGGPFDAVYLDKRVRKFELLTVWHMLARRGGRRSGAGLLTDLRGGPEQIFRWLPDGFPLYADGGAEGRLGALMEQLSEAMAAHEYGLVKTILDRIGGEFPQDRTADACRSSWNSCSRPLWTPGSWNGIGSAARGRRNGRAACGVCCLRIPRARGRRRMSRRRPRPPRRTPRRRRRRRLPRPARRRPGAPGWSRLSAG